MSLIVTNAPPNYFSLETRKMSLEEIFISNPDLTKETLKISKKKNGSNLYAIAVMSDESKKTVHFKFDEKGKKPFANAQAWLSKNFKEGKESVIMSCMIFDHNSRTPKSVQLKVQLKGFTDGNGRIFSYVKVNSYDTMRYEINGIYVSENEMNEMIRLKGKVAEYKPESFEIGKETGKLKVPANLEKKVVETKNTSLNSSPSRSDVVVTSNQEEVKSFEKMTPDDRKELKDRLTQTLNKLQTQLSRLEKFEEAEREDAEARRAIQEMAAARGMPDVTPQIIDLFMSLKTH